MKKARQLTLVLAVGILAGCSAGGTTAPSSPPSASPTATIAAATPAITPAASGTATLPLVHDGTGGPISAGTYVTGQEGFLPGLGIMIPAGWTANETDDGEISLAPADRPDDKLLIWKDLAAVVTHNRDGTLGSVLPNVGRTEAALIEWITTTKDFEIISAPKAQTVGDSIKGTELTAGVSATADFAEPDCPDNPRCAAFFTDPAHWGEDFYAIGGDEVARIFIGTAHFPDGDHTFFVTLDTPSQAELAAFAPIAAPIIASLKLPAAYVAN